MRTKKLVNCVNDEWVYFGYGELGLVKKVNCCDHELIEIHDGCMIHGLSDDTIVVPMSLHSKVIAEQVHYYADDMFKKKLINGSRWTNWLNEKFIELVEIDENIAGSEPYIKIYTEIKNKIEELYRIRKRITELEKQLK